MLCFVNLRIGVEEDYRWDQSLTYEDMIWYNFEELKLRVSSYRRYCVTMQLCPHRLFAVVQHHPSIVK